MGEQIKPKNTKMIFCGKEVSVPSINIEDHEYMWVRAIEKLAVDLTIEFEVEWNTEKNMPEVVPVVKVRG